MKTVLRTVCALACGVAGSLWADSGSWTAVGGGNWSDTANWSGGIVASNTGYTATFGVGSGTINNDLSGLTLAGLQFNGGAFTLAGNALTLDAAGFVSVVGTQTVAAAVSLSGTTTVSLASAQVASLNGLLSGAGGLRISGGRTVLGYADNAYAGPTLVVTGILDVASVDALGDSSTDPANFVLGDAVMRYTGASATLARGLTLVPTNFGTRATGIDVTTANTTLTLAGKVACPAGSFVKTGPGTLAYTYPGYQELNKSRGAVNEGASLVYDANGSLGTNGYAIYTVDNGKVILGAPGQTNMIVGVAWVGGRNNNVSPRMEVVGGVTKVTGTYFTIGRGTGTAPYLATPSLYIGNGAYMEMASFVMANYNGNGNFRCNPVLAVTNGTLVVFGDCFLSENTVATCTVSVANSSLFRNDSAGFLRGMILGFGGPAKTDVLIDNASTGRVYMARLARLTSMTVSGNSVFEMDTTPTNSFTDPFNNNSGRVTFNGAKLAPRTPKLAADWFAAQTNILVGANGLTIDTTTHAYLDPQPRAEPVNAGGKITKTGAGSLALRPTPLNVDVTAGKLLMSIEHPVSTNTCRGVVTVSPGASLELAAAGAAGGMRLDVADTPLALTPHSLISNPDLWAFNGSFRRHDGILQLTTEVAGSGSGRGVAYLRRKQTVSGPWTATFNYICWGTQGNPADAVAFVLQNDPRGLSACGTGASSAGYADTGSLKVLNSVGVGLDVYNHRIMFGKQGAFVVTNSLPSVFPKLNASPVKTKVVVGYDGAGLLTVDLSRAGYPSCHYSWAVNVATEVGASDAYLGFAGATGGAYGQHCFTDLLFDNGLTTFPSFCRYGGNVTLAGGATLNAVSTPSSQQRGFVLGALNYGDQSVVNADASTAATFAPPSPTLLDQGLWKTNGYANWKPDGRLAISMNQNDHSGTAFTTNLYPISGNWTARFNYDMGLHTAPPADYIMFVVQNSTPNTTTHTPNPGFAIQWRYYMGGTNSTMVRMYKNGVETLGSTNIAPVSLYSNPLATMTVSYNASAQTVTVITEQTAGAYTNVFTGVDMNATVGTSSAYLGFAAFTGGLNAENIVSDFSFNSGSLSSANGSGYLAFERLSGTGTLIKRGAAPLGLLGDIDQPTSNRTVRLEKGGLVLCKNNLEPLSVVGARSEWVFSPEAKWGDDDTLQLCMNNIGNSTATATTARRIRVKEAFTVTYNFLFGARSNPPADAYSIFFHNDPRGPNAIGGPTMGAGYNGGPGNITPSIGLRWYFYPNNGTSLTNTIAIGRAGVWNDGTRQSHMPVALLNGTTTTTIHYDPVAATLTCVMTQGVYGVTNVFTGVNIPTDVGSDYAYLGFGGGCGGAYGELRVRDFKLTYDSALTDTVADQSYLASLVLPDASTNTVTLDASVAGGTYKIASATVGAGAALGVNAASQPGTLAIGSVAQSGTARYTVASGNALVLNGVSGGQTLVKSGSGTLALAGATATYTDSTVLSAGTLSLDAARLPTTTDLRVTTGATLNLAFSGFQRIHALYVDGVPMHGGRYSSANTAWISGAGVLVVTYPPVGSVMTVK